MRGAGERGSIVTVLCDGGERYGETYFDERWLAANDLRCDDERRWIAQWIDGGQTPAQAQSALALAGF